MLEKILLLDRELLLRINGSHTPAWNTAMWYLSASWTWIPVYLLLLYAVRHTFSVKYAFYFMVFAAIAVGCADYVASGVLKPLVMRLRPCHDASLAEQIFLVRSYCGGQYGFASSHAANFFALATITSLTFRQYAVTLLAFVCAAAVAYSRLYLGVHYPTDVLAGGAIGAVFAAIAYGIFAWRIPRREHIR